MASRAEMGIQKLGPRHIRAMESLLSGKSVDEVAADRFA